MLKKALSKRDDGFTLIELLVVVIIIGILAAIAIPVYLNSRKSASDKAAQSDMRNAIMTLETCNLDNGAYPTAVDSVGAVTGCANQDLTLTPDTNVRYVANAPRPHFVMFGYNSGGTTVYCYSSQRGGSFQKARGSVLATATCP